jgi:hypothetical protein
MFELASIIRGWHNMTETQRLRIELDRLKGEYRRLVDKWNKDTTILQMKLDRAMDEVKGLVEDDGVKDFDVIKKRILEGE